MPRYGSAASKRVESAMRRRNKGTLMSGPGGKGGRVKSRKQAIAIGLSEARAKGAKVPRRASSPKRSRHIQCRGDFLNGVPRRCFLWRSCEDLFNMMKSIDIA